MIRIAVVGTGGISHWHASAFRGMKGCRLTAACDVRLERARAWATKYGLPPEAAFDNVAAMLKQAAVDAVVVATNDAAHAPVALACIAAGKHVLCEKPLATNYADARRMAVAAQRKGVVNMVHLSYRNASAIHKAHELVVGGAIGRVMHVHAFYLQGWLDANDSAVLTVEFAGGAMGVIHTTRWATGHKNSLRLEINGDKGAVVVDLDRSYSELQICRGRDVDRVAWKTIKCGSTPSIQQRFARSIRTGRCEQPDFARGAVVQKVLDASFASDRAGRAVKV